MSDQPPKKLPISISGVSESEAIRLIQEVSAQLGLTMTFEAGSNVSFYIYLPGACMKEQNASHTTTTVGNISDSTVGAVGAARDVSVFINRVDSSQLPDDAKLALKNAHNELGIREAEPVAEEAFDHPAGLALVYFHSG